MRKPTALTISEGRKMADMIIKKKVIFQLEVSGVGDEIHRRLDCIQTLTILQFSFQHVDSSSDFLHYYFRLSASSLPSNDNKFYEH